MILYVLLALFVLSVLFFFSLLLAHLSMSREVDRLEKRVGVVVRRLEAAEKEIQKVRRVKTNPGMPAVRPPPAPPTAPIHTTGRHARL